MGWDFIKIAGFVSQYQMLLKPKSNFLGNINLFLKNISSIRDAFLVFISVDLTCKLFPKLARAYYKNLLFPVKVWSACLTIYEDKYIADSLKDSFSYFNGKLFKIFYTKSLVSLFLLLITVPVIFSLGILLLNFEYFSTPQCLYGNCFFIIVFFLIFMSLGFFFSYSINLSIESAYYVKLLNEIKEGKIPDKETQRIDSRVKFVEEETNRKISKLKGNTWDVFRIYF